jgi:CYTH domain-containing protein
MSYEIERKFLLKNDDWLEGATAHSIQQGYLAREPHRTVRVRKFDDQAWMTVKGPTTGITRQEVEFPLDPAVAEELFALCLEGMIHKTRHTLMHEGHLWEVDEFYGNNQGLVIAEIELADEATAFARPDWLGPEVSADRRFSNSALAQKPWGSWTAEERAEVLALARQD